MKKLMLLLDCPPHASLVASERLDLALMAAAFEQRLTVVFLGEGVWQLLSPEEGDELPVHDFAAAYRSLPLYGVPDILVERESLLEKGLRAEQLRMPVTVIERPALLAAMQQQDVLL